MNTANFPAHLDLLASLRAERVRLGQWAFAAAVRLSDQNRPIALKLIIESMIVLRALAQWLRPAPAVPACTARSSAARSSAAQARRGPLRQRSTAVAQRRTPHGLQHGAKGRGSTAPASMIARRQRPRVLQKSRFLCMVGLRG